MLFSVLIPTHSRPAQLRRCVEKLIADNQGIFDFEIIISYDDELNDAYTALAAHYNCVQLVKSKGPGPATSRNTAADFASGEWLVFIDDDSTPGSFLLQAYSKQITHHPECKVFEGAILAETQRQRFDEEAPLNWEGGHLWSCNFCIQKEYFFSIGGFDQTFILPLLEDVDLRIRIQKNQQPICFTPEAVVIHPWRIYQPYRNIRRRLKKHRYFFRKHHRTGIAHRIERSIFFIKEFVKLTGHLFKYSCKGFHAYVDKNLVNFLLIFY